MKEYDFYLASAMCIIALVLYLIIYGTSSKGDKVLVFVDNSLIDEYKLSDDGDYHINNENGAVMTFEIDNGCVNVISSNCKDKLCVHQKSIRSSSEVICCLPNKIILKIETLDNTSKDSYDAVTN